MKIEEARRIAQRHEDTYNNDFEHYHDLYAQDFLAYRPVSGVTHNRTEMYALEQRATAACPDRKTKVLRVLAAQDDWFGIEELWTGTNTGGRRDVRPGGDETLGLRLLPLRGEGRQVRPCHRLDWAATAINQRTRDRMRRN
ncbi:MAG: hypothetical protein IPI85_15020 [Dehalococcoidia bacterium]|nr:hypothetical protein [Dehalococcoidia bacterium]